MLPRMWCETKRSEVNTFVLKYLFQLLLNCAGGVYF